MKPHRINWIKVFLALSDTLPSSKELIVEGLLFRFQPIIVLEKEQLGYLVIWQPDTKVAVHLSRYRIPTTMTAISSTALAEGDIPDDLVYQPFV